MTIKFEDMNPDVQQSVLRVIEGQFDKFSIEGGGYEIAASAMVKTVKSAFEALYEEDNPVVIHDGVAVTPKEKE